MHSSEIQLSIVVPVHNEAENLGPLLQRLSATLADIASRHELIFVDDGSSDQTFEFLRAARAAHPQIEWIRLSRNFGHQAALVAGLAHARGDAVVTLDGDLQHPPELIPELIARWRAGADVVQAVRRSTADAGWWKRTSSEGFYRFLRLLTQIHLTPGSADFRLLSRRAVDAFLQCTERQRFNRGLVHWIGFSYAEVPYDAGARGAGETKYTLRKMLRLAGDAVFSFSSWPLRFAGLAGVCVSLAAFVYLVFVLWAYFFTALTVPGWSSILATLLILGGMQLVVLWIIGEYLGRLYEEAKRRPLYVVREATVPIVRDSAGAADAEPPTRPGVSAPPVPPQPPRPSARLPLDED